MASDFTFNEGALRQALVRLEQGIQMAAQRGMEEAMAMAEMDAQALARWRQEGTYTETYASGTWTWTVTDMARSSITAYVVPRKKLKQLPTMETTSFWNGTPKRHPHSTDDSVTGDHVPKDDTVIGVVTMNVAYAPFLQEHEQQKLATYPVTVEVLEMNWSKVYIPSAIRPMMERIMAQYATL